MTTAATQAEHGNRHIAMGNLILRCTVGSQVHGIAIEGTDDHDEMAVYVEPKDHVYGTRPAADHYVWRTQPEGHRSGPGDTDLVAYSLRKYLRLAAKGNPTALLPLYAPDEHILHTTHGGDMLRNRRDAFLSQQAVRRFLGYMDAQHKRMLGGGKRNRVPNRPELVERYGYDVKYAAHALRLSMQGYEVARLGTLTLPLSLSHRKFVLAVKSGEWTVEAVSAHIMAYAAQTRRLLNTGQTPLPEHPDWDLLNRLSIIIHEMHWSQP